MTDDRARRVRALFDRLIELAPEARAAALDAECAGDPDLRRELEDLLAQDQPTADLRVTPVLERLRRTEPEPVIGPYRIERPLGEGGFGEVFVAEQTAPLRRRVALKILKAGMDTKSVLARFEAERQTLAVMDHPNIAKVHDAGVTPRGLPYFVMELVDGEPLTAFADRHDLAIRERLELFIAITQAVQHAHQKGIIHRDLKPSNVLVSMVDGKPLPKVIDFGIAKATSHGLNEATLFTEAGQVVGTPEYMSPEQAELGGLDVDTRTDIYSLGVMLYELLTGSLPFEPAMLRQAGLARIQQIIREEEPQRPSTRVTARGAAGTEAAAHRRTEPGELARLLRGDLDWIVLRAMEKDRARRYDSAGALAADIVRYLKDEPVFAGPPSVSYRAGKFAKRHRVALTVGAVVLASLLAGLFESNRQRIVAQKARVEAERARDESEAVTGFLSDMLESADPRVKGKDVSVRAIIDSAATTIEEKFAEQPLVRARLMQTMGVVYLGLGLYTDARPLIDEAVAIREAELGPDHPDLAFSLDQQAILLMETGNGAAARPRYERALAIWEKSEGPEGPNVAKVLTNLANVHWSSGDYMAARPLLERSLAIREKLRGPDHPDVAQTLNNLGGLLTMIGEYEKAIQLQERGLAIREKALGPDHPAVAHTLSNLAACLTQMGDHPAAVRHFERALAIREKALGPSHPETAISLDRLGGALIHAGEPERARPYLERAAEIFRGGTEHWRKELASTLGSLATIALNEADTGRARLLFNEARAVQAEALGPDHFELAGSMRGLAAVEAAEGNFERAKALLEEALRIAEKAFGTEHPYSAETMKQFAGVLRKLGDTTRADSLDARAKAIMEPDTAAAAATD